MNRKTILVMALLISLTLLFYRKILLTNLILVGTDTFLYFYPYKAYAAEALRQGRIPLWNPHLFMGAPLLANSQVGLFYPLNWPLIGLSAPKQLAWSIGLHIMLAGGLMYYFARQILGLQWLSGLTAAILFAFGGYLSAQVEHINQLNAAVWLPLLFLLYEKAHRQNRLYWLGLALVIGLTLLAGHAQTVFIALFGLGLYALWRAMEAVIAPAPPQPNWQKHLKRVRGRAIPGSLGQHMLPLAAACALAMAIAAIQLLPTAELSSLSIRQQGLTFQEVVSFSLNPTTLHYSLLPPYGLTLVPIMGEAFSEWVAYMGLSGLILAALGMLTAHQQAPARRLLFVAMSGFLLSFGLFLGPLYLFAITIGTSSAAFHTLSRLTHPYYLLYSFVPGFDLFRVPARWLLLYSFGLAGLAGYGMESLLRDHLSHTLRHAPSSLHEKRSLQLLLLMLALLLAALFLWQPPPLTTLLIWSGLALLTMLILWLPRHAPYRALLLLMILTGELLFASQNLNLNQPTAPQAYHSYRNSVAFLESAPHNDRFLSLSGITYDPGDMAAMQQIYGDTLTEEALYKLLVASKQKEVLFFNLPLIYGLNSVDGYDGGILPLAKFVTLQRLFLPADNLSIDGRLREKLRYVPENRLLSMLNTRWIITDKQFDAWINGIFYDLQFPARLRPSDQISTTEIPEFVTTALGLVSHLEGAATLPAETPIARLTLTMADASTQTITLHAGRDTAEGQYEQAPQPPAHPQAQVGVAWPYGEPGVSYISQHPISSEHALRHISITALLPEGQFVLRGLSLINDPTTTSRSVILSTEGDYQRVHSGDVKIYENRNLLPRAYLVHALQTVTSTERAISMLRNPTFDIRSTALHVDASAAREQRQEVGSPTPTEAVVITHYAPERVTLTATLESPGWLILSDTAYPGWQATVNGHPTEIVTVNILFRGLVLPAGTHTIQFEFAPASYRWGAFISGSSLLGLLALGGLIRYKQRRQT